jgi:hypothetical protein
VSVGEILALIAFMMFGNVPLALVGSARRRKRRILFSLIAALYMPLCGSMLVLAGAWDEIWPIPLRSWMMYIGGVYGLIAIVVIIRSVRSESADD